MKPFSPFQLGKFTLPNPIFYAPLAGCSDFPFRQMSAKYSPGLMYCEMVKMDALVRHDPNTFRMLDFEKGMHPIGGQLCGAKPQLAGKAAKIIEELGFDVVDLNCGCPVDKVTKDGSGSGLLKTPQLIGEILAEMVAAVKIPVTLKIRAGWDEENICAEEVTQIAEQAGAQAIAIHGRTRQQAYRGPANWDYIKASKQAAKNIKVIGNGDVVDPESAKRMFEYTGCDAVLVARGTMGQPWIAQDILSYLKGEQVPVRTPEDCRQALYTHFLCAEKYYNPRQVVVEMRRVGCWYIKSSSGTREFRGLISRASSPEEVRHLIQNFSFSHENEATHSLNSDADCEAC
ncbi:tRNA dihydrouridine synthase DusB [Parachlamydia sp. AcF125]|uniref:tRNA dihydrouridine synthase DusB n=1 Tax=Parachlamydia sp. AcF125 TaxID=2795736 RepID=UPI001BC9F2E1|nr:tRNA dihydrouridine synthase DusB [Parachlamydia sp. AcF125]MBS4167874.1 putative tRNA-dihydrouridine synthase [Parachlamydia sp. AcF125]